ncbi:hypothetical protein LQW54_003086 [Pestalotiopsis sp. IQ-011]
MAQAGDHKSLPPGLRPASYVFDFTAAVQMIRKKVPLEYREYEKWNDLLGFVFEQAMAILKTNDEHTKEYSLLFVQVHSLERLCIHLFGIVAGRSPWSSMAKNVNRSTKNGQNDKVISSEELLRLSQEDGTRDVSDAIAFGETSIFSFTPPQIGIDNAATVGKITGSYDNDDKPDKNHKKIMAQAGQIEFPPGVTERRAFDFDFCAAVQSIRNKLPCTIREALWKRTLQIALDQTTDELKSRVGLAGPPSPWKPMLQSVDWVNMNGLEDSSLPIQQWFEIVESLKKEENIVCTIATGCLRAPLQGSRFISISNRIVVERIIKEYEDADDEGEGEGEEPARPLKRTREIKKEEEYSSKRPNMRLR